MTAIEVAEQFRSGLRERTTSSAREEIFYNLLLYSWFLFEYSLDKILRLSQAVSVLM